MIRSRSRRMTVAQLKERMDARFNTIDKRFDARDQKLDEHLASITLLLKHHDRVVDEHDKRLKDLGGWRRTEQDTVRQSTMRRGATVRRRRESYRPLPPPGGGSARGTDLV
jgi:hypothetical protein